MKIRTIDGEIVTIYKKDIIYNALYIMAFGDVDCDEVYLSLKPRSDGILVYRSELRELIYSFYEQYA